MTHIHPNSPIPLIRHFCLMLLFVVIPVAAAAQFTVTDRFPAPNSVNLNASVSLEIEFSQDVNFSSVPDGVIVSGSVSGPLQGAYTLSESNRITFRPTGGFIGGEMITVVVTEDVLSSDNVPLGSPEQWSFRLIPDAGSDRFSERETISLEQGSEPSAIVSADLTNNFMPDLVVVNSNNTVITILENRNLENLGFQVAGTINTGVEEMPVEDDPLMAAQGTTLPANASITSGDLNGNGFLDLAVASTLTNELIVLLNSADGQPNLSPQLIETGERPVKVVAADMNNNGIPDLVAASAGSDRVFIHYNNGDGSFGAPQAIDVGLAPLKLEVADINNNGLMDIVVPLSGENTVIALVNQGAQNFTEQVLLSELSFTPSFLTIGNFIRNGGDQLNDLALGSTDESTIYLYENSGTGFSLAETITSGESRPVDGLGMDFTANGFPDLLSSRFSANSLSLALNSSTGFSGEAILTGVPGPVGLTSADFNYSGSMDIAVTNFTTGEVTILYNDARRDACLVSEGFDFGDVCLFELAEQDIPIENVCTFPLEVSVEVTGDGFETTVSSFEIEPGEVFLLPVSFLPEERRTYNGSIVAGYIREGGVIDVEESVSFPLQGRGVITELTVPSSVSFGEIEIGDSSSRQIQISNTGDVTNSLTIALETEDGIFEYTGDAEVTLSAGSQLTVTVEFTPQQAQNYSNQLVIFSESDCGDEEYRIDLTGTGVDPPPPLPDLVAVSLEPVPATNTFTYGETYAFEGLLRLDGEMIVSDPFDVVFEINGDEAERFRVSQTLNPGDTRSFILERTFLREGSQTITFIVDAENEIEESDETNNQVSLTIDIERGRLAVSPNPFTPNNDGFNDAVEFNFENVGVVSSPVIRIFSFHGKLVRTITGMAGNSAFWDGLDDNGNRLNPGVYLYVVQENNELIGRGSVTLAL